MGFTPHLSNAIERQFPGMAFRILPYTYRRTYILSASKEPIQEERWGKIYKVCISVDSRIPLHDYYGVIPTSVNKLMLISHDKEKLKLEAVKAITLKMENSFE